MIRKILFATDLGVFTPHALLHVESLARKFDARVIIAHAVPPFGDFATAVVKSQCSENVKLELMEDAYLEGLLDNIRNEIFEMLMRADLAELDIGRWIEDIVVTPGNAAAVILEQAEKRKSDLIVVGSHSPQALDERLLGSVATRVLQLARVPVFLVPMAKDPFGIHWGEPPATNDTPSQFGT